MTNMAEETECFICGTHRPNSIEIHHVVPRRYGGSDAPENLVNLCSSCHSAIENIYDDSFYERLGVEEADISIERNLDIAGTKVPSKETKDRTYPANPVHIRREDFGYEINFAQYMIYQMEDLIPSDLPEADLLIEKLEDYEIETLRNRVREWNDFPHQARTLATAYPEDERLTPPVRIVKSNQTTEYDSTSANILNSEWFSRLHCGYCHTVYAESEKADLAAHLRVQHRIENPYESEGESKETLTPGQG